MMYGDSLAYSKNNSFINAAIKVNVKRLVPWKTILVFFSYLLLKVAAQSLIHFMNNTYHSLPVKRVLFLDKNVPTLKGK